MPAVIETTRLLLRPLAAGDLTRLADLANNYRVTVNTATMPWPYTLNDALSFLRRVQANRRGTRFFALAAKHEEGSLIGGAGYLADTKSPEAEIGYWIAEPYWARGYGIETASAVLADAFTDAGHERVVAAYRHGNEGSRRTLDRLGFRFIGHRRNHSLAFGGDYWIAGLELTKREWLRHKPQP
jgi:RimJ/RimL family protein N-acetyltransferase